MLKSPLLNLLRCPDCESDFQLTQARETNGSVESGQLVCGRCDRRYSIINFIPRFVLSDNSVDSFGYQWNRFRQTQLDSHSGHPISAERFWRATGWKPEELRGQWVLDVGCGSGRFAEVALNAGAKVVALDYSSAVDVCYTNLKHHSNLYVIQGDVYALPFAQGSFPYVYSLGVLQHTPDVARAFAALPPMLAAGGRLCADFYWNRFRTLMHPKYLLRPFTKRMNPQKLFSLLEASVPTLLRFSQLLGRVPLAGQSLKRVVPVVDYTGIYPLSSQQLEEWALLDTFDMLAPAYDQPQSAATIMGWFKRAGLNDVEVFHCGHLVGRGRKSVVV